MSPPRALRCMLLAGLALPVLAATAAAQNASTAGAIELYPTIQSVGARLAYTGDANANATAHLEWRTVGGAWKRGIDMTRITGARWAGSVFWLAASTLYEVRAVITDPDGGGSAQATVQTRADSPPSPTGTTRWVAVNGNDGNAGTSSAPLATLQAAADRSRPGDQIRVKAGVYRQSVHPNVRGSSAALVHLVADPGAVLDGSDPAFLHRTDWRDDGGGVFSVAFASVTRLVCADTAQRLYPHATLADLRAGAQSVAQGFVIESGRLWVRLEDGSSPAAHEMHVARDDIGVSLEVDGWRVQGFEIRFFGTSAAAAGIALRAASKCVIEGNYIHVIGGRGIFMRVGAADNLVQANRCVDPRIASWPWLAVEVSPAAVSGISNRGGRGNVIRRNIVTGFFDGLDATNGQGDETVCSDNDYHDNVITGVRDDAIETDTVAGINLRLWRNRIDRCYSGISVAPIYQGPEYILYNTVANCDLGGFKFSLDGVGHAWICHNTVAMSVYDAETVHPTGHYSNIHFRNNVLVGRNAPSVGDDAGESQTGNDFNGDLLFTNISTLFRWKGTSYSSVSALRGGTGFEANGKSGDPMFRAAVAGDYNLLPTSPAVNAALPLPGINDGWSGTGPDMGAYEYNLVLDAPVATRVGLALEAPAPNPTRSGTLVAFTLPSPGSAVLAIFDVSGRRVRTLAEGALSSGRHTLRWDRVDEAGARVAAGVYFVALSFGQESRSGRIVVVD